MGQLNKTAVVNGTPLEYAPDDLHRDRVITVVVTGAGDVTITAVHLDGDPVTLVDGETLPILPKTLYGTGYSKVTVINDSGAMNVTIASSRF